MIKTENRIVCFIDVLGYSEIVRQFELTQDLSIVEKIQIAFNESMDFISSPDVNVFTKEQIDQYKKRILFKTFSDNIMIAAIYSETTFFTIFEYVLTFSNAFQNNMLRRGVYTRGGISHGLFYSDENIIFSHALVKAYEVESKIALYPRIVIDKLTVDKIKSSGMEMICGSHVGKMIYFDWEWNAFINPIGIDDYTYWDTLQEYLQSPESFPASFRLAMTDKLLDSAKNAIEQHAMQVMEISKKIRLNLNNSNFPERVRSKYNWLLQFYMWRYSKESSLIKFVQLKDVKPAQ
jgi:hypothetical protein